MFNKKRRDSKPEHRKTASKNDEDLKKSNLKLDSIILDFIPETGKFTQENFQLKNLLFKQ